MTENPEIGVFVHIPNPAGFFVQPDRGGGAVVSVPVSHARIHVIYVSLVIVRVQMPSEYRADVSDAFRTTFPEGEARLRDRRCRSPCPETYLPLSTIAEDHLPCARGLAALLYS